MGVARAWPLPRVGGETCVKETWGRPAFGSPENGGCGPLIYGNFPQALLVDDAEALGLPAVTPHSARHSFISTLQAQGVEVGLVAKLAGHKNAVVTLSHYTHAMRGGEDAVEGARSRLCGDGVMNEKTTERRSYEDARQRPFRTSPAVPLIAVSTSVRSTRRRFRPCYRGWARLPRESI